MAQPHQDRQQAGQLHHLQIAEQEPAQHRRGADGGQGGQGGVAEDGGDEEPEGAARRPQQGREGEQHAEGGGDALAALEAQPDREEMADHRAERSEEHTSELQSLMRISYAVFCLKKKKTKQTPTKRTHTIDQSENKK